VRMQCVQPPQHTLQTGELCQGVLEQCIQVNVTSGYSDALYGLL